jgi:hypothetical protein
MKITMKRSLKIVFIICAIALQNVQAGNPDRAGGAGATQLLFNPYARSFGYGGVNTSSVKGLESFYLNIAGLANSDKTEVNFSRQNYLMGAGVNINNLGIAQKIGENGGVIGLGVMSFDFGNIPTASYENPDLTLPYYNLQVLNFGFSYAKKFSNSISGGILLRIASEGVSNASSSGTCIDGGVQYQTSINRTKKIKKEDFRFGISVRNLGPNMSYFGNGLSFRSINQSTGADRRALMAAESFNMPALVHIGASYDMRLDGNPDTYNHKLTASGNFNYNAFQSDVLGLGAEYSYKDAFMVRAAYNHIEGNFSSADNRQPVYGIYSGFTLQMPVNNSGTILAFDYGYAPTRFFSGIQTIGVRLSLGNSK